MRRHIDTSMRGHIDDASMRGHIVDASIGSTTSTCRNVRAARRIVDVNTSDEARRVTLDVGGHSLVFVQVAGDTYAAQVDGRPCKLRVRDLERSVGEGFAGEHRESSRPASDEASLGALLRCLSHEPERTMAPRALTLSASHNWGHFRQNTFITVTVTIADDGAIEIVNEIQEQDESYY